MQTARTSQFSASDSAPIAIDSGDGVLKQHKSDLLNRDNFPVAVSNQAGHFPGIGAGG